MFHMGGAVFPASGGRRVTVSGMTSRTLSLSIIAVLISAGCASDGGAEISAEEAKDSMCVHVMGITTSAATRSGSNQNLLADALEVDRRLLAAAGDNSTAATVEQTVDQLRSGAGSIPVTAYLVDDLPEAARDQIVRVLDQDADVASYQFVSSEQAFEEFKELYADQPEFYANLPSDALPASFRIRTAEGSDVNGLLERLEELNGLDQVRSEGELVRFLEALRPLAEVCDVRLPFDGP